jgi:CRISPR-associated protein Csx3
MHLLTFANYPELARQLKEEYKAKFTREFALGKARDVKVIKNSLLLFDVGGRLPSDENKFIMSEATHAVILAKTEADVIAWEQLCEKHLPQTLPVIAILYSDRDGKNDEITCESPVLIGKVHHLERGQDVSGRPMVKALANLVVNLAVTASAISD